MSRDNADLTLLPLIFHAPIHHFGNIKVDVDCSGKMALF